nr:XRE family transcriptional regulator [Maliibacterium massiliense]
MKVRKQPLGARNMIGARVTCRRQELGMLQVELQARLAEQGIVLSTSALSLLEGQKRLVSDVELIALARVLRMSVTELLGLSRF